MDLARLMDRRIRAVAALLAKRRSTRLSISLIVSRESENESYARGRLSSRERPFFFLPFSPPSYAKYTVKTYPREGIYIFIICGMKRRKKERERIIRITIYKYERLSMRVASEKFWSRGNGLTFYFGKVTRSHVYFQKGRRKLAQFHSITISSMRLLSAEFPKFSRASLRLSLAGPPRISASLSLSLSSHAP